MYVEACVGAPGCGAADACGRQFFNDGGGRSPPPCVPGRTSRPGGVFGCPSADAQASAACVPFRALREARRSRCAAKRRAPRLSGWGACQTVLEIVAKRSARELAWLYFLMMPAISSGRR